MKILVSEPYQAPEWRDIENELEPMKEIVDGWLEVIPTSVKGVVIVGDEEAKLKNKRFNFITEIDTIAGTVFFASVDGEDFASLTEEQAKEVLKKYFPAIPCPPMPR